MFKTTVNQDTQHINLLSCASQIFHFIDHHNKGPSLTSHEKKNVYLVQTKQKLNLPLFIYKQSMKVQILV